MFYDNLLKLCSLHKTSPTAVAKAIGLSGAAASGWKKGKEPFPATYQKIADHFGVSVRELQKETPVQDVDERREVSDKDLMFALWGDTDDMDEADLADVRRYADFVRDRKKRP